METINIKQAVGYAKQLISDKRITRQEASKYIMKNYRVLGGLNGERELTSPFAIAVKLSRTEPMSKRDRSITAGIAAARSNSSTNSGTEKSNRKRRNMDAHHLRRDIRGVLSMSLSDNVKLLIIKEMTA